MLLRLPRTLQTSLARNHAQPLVQDLLAEADIRFDGDRPWDIRVRDPGLYERILRDGSLGAGEGYMLGEWDCDDLVELMARAGRADLEAKLKGNTSFVARMLLLSLITRLQFAFNRDVQGQRLSAVHYDLGNDYYAAWLDQRMLYTCGYWKDAQTIDEAQEAKVRLACEKLLLGQPRPDGRRKRLLEIGCGWGGMSLFAAEYYDVEVTGISISTEPLNEAERRRQQCPSDVADRISFRLQDYRDVADGPYDAVIAMGMLEHVGRRNYRRLFDVVHQNLDPNGLFLLQTIGADASLAPSVWLNKYIFPHSELPTPTSLADAYESKFVMEDWHNFGAYYERTCLAWWERFDHSWPRLRAQFGDGADRFYRMQKLYLLGCAGYFRSRTLQLWQIVLSKSGLAGGYNRIT